MEIVHDLNQITVYNLLRHKGHLEIYIDNIGQLNLPISSREKHKATRTIEPPERSGLYFKLKIHIFPKVSQVNIYYQ